MALVRLTLFLVIAATLACTSSSNGPNRPGDGTSDSGGGNGVENKAYEAYIVRTENLPAYKAIIEPKVAALLRLSPVGEKALPIFKRWLLYKTWYVAPVQLDTISTEVIGVSFSSDKTEQLAIQTKRSVWINSDRFKRMQIEDQAALILHEMVMSLYYLRFKSWNDICTEKIYPDIQCRAGDADVLNDMFPGSTPKPFDSNDYENIRAVTGALLQSASFGSMKEIDDLLLQNKFDRRFTFGFGMDGSGTSDTIKMREGVKISNDEIMRILETAQSLNQLPDECQGARFKNPFPCHFTFGRTTIRTKQGYEFPMTELKILSDDGKIQFSGLGSTLQPGEGTSFESTRFKRRVTYFIFNPAPFPTPNVRGTLFRSVLLITLENMEVPAPTYTLLGIQGIPGVVTGAHNQIPGECTYAKPSARSILDDTVIAYSQYLTDYDKSMALMMKNTFPPFTTCRPF